MSDGAARNQDKTNTLGIVVVGISASVLVYVSIAFLQAFYMNDTAEVQTMADYGGQEGTYSHTKAAGLANIGSYVSAPSAAGSTPVYQMPIDVAMARVVEDAKKDPANLVPTQGRADKPTAQPIYGRPKQIVPATAPTTPATPGTAPAAPAIPADPPGGPVPAPGAPGAAVPMNGGPAPATVIAPTPAPTMPAPAAPAAGGNAHCSHPSHHRARRGWRGREHPPGCWRNGSHRVGRWRRRVDRARCG